MIRALTLILLFIGAVFFSESAHTAPRHGFSLHGQPKYPPSFAHFDYVNPDAPKGGSIVLSAVGTYDNLNPYILKGNSASGLSLTFDTLMESSADEASTEYGLLAQSIDVAPDYKSVTFVLRPEARFHDGTPVTAADAAFTLETLKTKGHPFYRIYYQDITEAEVLGERTIRFRFTTDENRELPLIIGQMPILSKAFFTEQTFDQTTLKPVLGNGPYRVAQINPGRSITYERVEDYWGKDINVRRGTHNFDRIRYDYYRDATIAFEAFKAGQYDFHQEYMAKAWAQGYDFPAVRGGQIVRTEIPHQIPTGMQGFIYNTRREIFADPRVRQALMYAFDFEWSNQNLFFNAYTRTRSYFSNSELASSGLPEGRELEILNRYRDQLPPEVFTEPYIVPSTEPPDSLRQNLLKARDLLTEAGWELQGQQLVDARGRAFVFEILLVNPSFERIALPFVRNLRRLGIHANVRVVDASQYQKRVENFDFDMTVVVIGQSLSPGNEQRNYWGSYKADVQGSRNYAGITDPVVDQLIEEIVRAPTREELIARTRALDRVLLWGHYTIPHWHIRSFRIAYQNIFGRPEVTPPYALGFPATWWMERERPNIAAPASQDSESPWLRLWMAGGVIVVVAGVFLLRKRRK